MASVTLKALLNPRTGATPALAPVLDALGGELAVEDARGTLVLGRSNVGPARVPVVVEGETLGWVCGASESVAMACSTLLAHLAAKESERRALAGEVLHLYRELHLIEQLSEQLAALLDLSSVGQSALDQARRLISASHGAILVMVEPDSPLRPVASFGAPVEGGADPIAPLAPFIASVVERGVAEIVNDCAADPRAKKAGVALGSLVCAPLRAKQRTVGAVALGNAAGAAYSSADLQLLNTIALQTASAIESALLCAEMVSAARDREQLAALQKELDTARTIQQALVPRTFPPFPERTDFDIHAEMTAALAVGGDFFDFFLIDDEHLGVVIGDVSGKGIPAALYMAVARTQIRTIALQGLPPKECLLEVNRVLVREKVSAMFATCFYGILNTRSGEFLYCNGAHNPPYLLRASGGVERLPLTGGLPLGMFSRLAYNNAIVQLASGDALFLYTDGVPEATTAEQDDFTSERLVAALRPCATLSCQELIRHVTREVLAFTAGAPQSDDITMLAIRLRPSGQTAR
jgi:phosphoserine phosphatase RsbU/P